MRIKLQSLDDDPSQWERLRVLAKAQRVRTDEAGIALGGLDQERVLAEGKQSAGEMLVEMKVSHPLSSTRVFRGNFTKKFRFGDFVLKRYLILLQEKRLKNGKVVRREKIITDPRRIAEIEKGFSKS